MLMNVDIQSNFDALVKVANLLGMTKWENVQDGLFEGANIIKDAWVRKSNQVLEHSTGSYAKSIKIEELSNNSIRVYSDHPAAYFIEHGTDQFDMKKALQTSSRVRIVKKGKHAGMKYLIIPNIFGTPGAKTFSNTLTNKEYTEAQDLSQSRIKGNLIDINVNYGNVREVRYEKISGSNKLNKIESFKTGQYEGQSPTIKRNRYDWGGSMEITRSIDKKVSKQKLYRFNQNSENIKHSQYMSFLIMGEWQNNKWINKGIKPKKIRDQVYIETQVAVKDAVERAITEDLRLINNEVKQILLTEREYNVK